MRNLLGRWSPYLALVIIAACIGFGRYKVGGVALSQSAASVVSCSNAQDGGSGSVACTTPVNTNYTPVTVVCQAYATDAGGSTATGTLSWQVSPDGIHFGSFDGGVIGTWSATATTPGVLAAAMVVNPWDQVNIVDNGLTLVDGGAILNCTFGVLNVQNIH